MNINEDRMFGFCTICQTLHYSDEDIEDGSVCTNCGSHSVYSIVAASDRINDYERLVADYKSLAQSMDLGEYD